MSPADPPAVALLIGDEPLRLREAVDQLVAQVLGEGAANGFNFASYQADEADVTGRLLDTARTVPMMARVRVVLLKDFDKASVDLQEALLEYAEKPCPSTVLVVTGRKLPEASGGANRGVRLRNRVQKIGLYERFEAKSEDPHDFARDRAARLGVTLDPAAARLLVELSGRDLGRLDMELQKAAAWVGGAGTIDAAVVEATCSVVAEAEIWALTGALAAHDADAALAATHRLLEDGAAPHYLMAMLAWQFRQLLLLQDCLRQGRDPKTVGLRMQWQARKAAEQTLRRHPLSEERILARLARANHQLNRARAGDRRVFEGLVLDLVG
ncbi:MAG: DNA polymerase III subunit delta [Alphaproteobacteria bacterium]|nr:DNA polymerase III subunit delta [Alphaproteobacteria bacterium]